MSQFRALAATLVLIYSQQAGAGTMGDIDSKDNFNGLYLGLGTGFTTLFVSDNFTYSFPTNTTSSILLRPRMSYLKAMSAMDNG